MILEGWYTGGTLEVGQDDTDMIDAEIRMGSIMHISRERKSIVMLYENKRRTRASLLDSREDI